MSISSIGGPPRSAKKSTMMDAPTAPPASGRRMRGAFRSNAVIGPAPKRFRECS